MIIPGIILFYNSAACNPPKVMIQSLPQRIPYTAFTIENPKEPMFYFFGQNRTNSHGNDGTIERQTDDPKGNYGSMGDPKRQE